MPEGRASLPTKPVLITLDDGTDSQFTNALPVLNKYRFFAVFFIMTVSIGHTGYMSRAQIRCLSDQGFQIACHTWDHKAVTKYHSDEEYERQLLQPKQELEQIIGSPVTLFAYPYGCWDTAAIARLQQYGYDAAFQLSAVPDRHSPIFTIRRIMIDAHWDTSRLLKEIAKATR